MVAGDSLAHRFPQTYQSITHDSDREHYRKFVLKTMKFLALELRKRYPDTKILVTPGNNDEDCGNYSIEAGGRFLHDTAELVRDLAQGDDEMRGSWEALGSLMCRIQRFQACASFRSTPSFSRTNIMRQSLTKDAPLFRRNGPDEAFNWLESRLSKAKAAHEKVWMMFHIPPGIDSYASIQKYHALAEGRFRASIQSANLPVRRGATVAAFRTAQFDSLLEKYHGTVIASFSGHTHVDDFRVLKPSGGDAPFVLITPAISPIYNQNPSFRTVTFAKDGSLLDRRCIT